MVWVAETIFLCQESYSGRLVRSSVTLFIEIFRLIMIIMMMMMIIIISGSNNNSKCK